MVYLKSVEIVIILSKLIVLLFLFCLPLLSILFLKTKRNDLARPVMGTIFLVLYQVLFLLKITTLSTDHCDQLEAYDVEVEDGAFIHTVCIHDDSARDIKMSSIPLVMVHGIGGAIPAFYKNYQCLAHDRCVYGIHMPGFGLSKRVEFSNDPDDCEAKIVDLIDQWRTKMKIENMILLGHSFGGYIAGAYALRYHKHMEYLVLLDPWGVFSEEDDMNDGGPGRIEWIAKKICNYLKVNPFEKFALMGEMIGESSVYT